MKILTCQPQVIPAFLSLPFEIPGDVSSAKTFFKLRTVAIFSDKKGNYLLEEKILFG